MICIEILDTATHMWQLHGWFTDRRVAEQAYRDLSRLTASPIRLRVAL